MLRLFFLILLTSTAKAASSRDIINDIKSNAEVLRELSQIVSTIGLNCASTDKWAQAMLELEAALEGIVRVGVEQAQTLAYKPNYPTICHVLTQKQLDSFNDPYTKTGTDRFTEAGVTVTKEHFQPQPSYYWPKYFIEVSQKGNDPHPSFAKNNMLYTANRKVANSLESLIDFDGSLGLATKLLGASTLTSNLQQVDKGFNVRDYDREQMMTSATLTPFEKMRMRASQSTTQSSYEVNVWPVGISNTVGENLTVCGTKYKNQGKEIGYTWPLKGVPMTCPVSMSRDAYAFWDTGLIDYLDPQAVAAMGIAADPVVCGAAQAGQTFGEMALAERDPIGDLGPVTGAIGNMSSQLSKALKPCSWPIIGASEAIARKVIATADPAKWTGPYCTVWGSLAPRHSTSVYQNDYSFANSASSSLGSFFRPSP